MRVLLDEGVAHRLADALTAHAVASTPFPNDWKGLRNGRLLARAEAEGFSILLTNDRNLCHQQALKSCALTIVALPTSRPKVVLPRAHDIALTILTATPGDCVTINSDGSRRLQRQGVVSVLPPIHPFPRPQSR